MDIKENRSVSFAASFKDCLILPIRGHFGVITLPDFNLFEVFQAVCCGLTPASH